MTEVCEQVCKELKNKGENPTFVNARFVKPLDTELLDELAKDHKLFVTVEENVRNGGFGEHVAAYMEACHPEVRVLPIAIWNRFVEHGEIASLRAKIGLSAPDIFDAIEEWMRELLTGMITSNLDTMFTDVNQKTGEIATQVGQTPQGWNGSIFSMIRNLSDSVIMPIAGIIITLVLCYELISMLTERNNMHDIDTWMFFKYFVKMWIAVYLVSNTFTITMAVFDVGQHVVNSAAGVITGSTAIDISSALTDLSTTLESMEIGELVVLALETLIVGFCMKILSVLITVIMYGRMIEIYLYTSVAPIPFATMSNREWGQIGTNYFRGLFALAFQAFLMMVCVAIYAVLVAGIQYSDNLSSSLFGVMAYTVILCYSLFKTASLSKSIFNAH